ncbi:hypothetical protein ACOMHN_051477 [Nucella lapillus]
MRVLDKLGWGWQPMSKQQVLAVGVLCQELVIVQGSPETGFLTHQTLREADTDHFEDGDYGLPAGDYSVRLMSDMHLVIPPDQERVGWVGWGGGYDGQVGDPGEVEVKGGQMSSPYGEKTKTLTDDGWMKTGEVAIYNASQHLQAVCRKNNVIIHGPYLIYPRWLEKMMEDCPGVTRVVIVPVPDPKMFQELCACILPDRGEVLKDAEIKAFCHTLFVDGALECNHIPKYYLFVQDLPNMLGQMLPDRKKIFFTAMTALKLSVTAL